MSVNDTTTFNAKSRAVAAGAGTYAPTFPPRVKKTHLHLDRVDPDLMLVRGNEHLTDASVLLMTAPDGKPIQMTICRPIGNVPGLDPKADFVMIPSHDIPSFLTNIKNPDEGAILKKFESSLSSLYLKKGLLEKKGDIVVYPGTNIDRAATLDAARKKADAANKELRKAHFDREKDLGHLLPGEKQPTGQKLPTAKPYTGVIKVWKDFIDDKKILDAEEKIYEFRQSTDPDIVKLTEGKITSLRRYEVLGGADGTAKQSAVPILKGIDPKKVVQTLVKGLRDLKPAA